MVDTVTKEQRPIEDLYAELRVAVETRDRARDAYAEAVQVSNDRRSTLMLHANTVERLYQACRAALDATVGKSEEGED